MTLTDMIKAHDPELGWTDALLESMDKAFGWSVRQHHSERLLRDDILKALSGDLSAAWRLLPEGRSWEGMNYDPHEKFWVVSFWMSDWLVTTRHKSLPCAMVLAALQAWEIE